MYVHPFGRDVYIHISSVRGYVCAYMYTRIHVHIPFKGMYVHITCIRVCEMYIYVCTYVGCTGTCVRICMRIPFEGVYIYVYTTKGCTYTCILISFPKGYTSQIHVHTLRIHIDVYVYTRDTSIHVYVYTYMHTRGI